MHVTHFFLAFQLLIFPEFYLQSQTTGVNWLSSLPDDTALQTIHIPGTHNSAAHFEPLPGTAKCQSLSIAQQLDVGVRMLDIRCRHVKNRFHLYHGVVDQKQTFTLFQETLNKFLSAHPSELVLISIQETAPARDNTRPFAQTFAEYRKQAPELWSDITTPKTLAEGRGQAILIRRFASPDPLGIPATNWNSKRIHATKRLLIQDHFKTQEPANKWIQIERLWEKQPQHPGLLALNFTSAYQSGSLGIPNITAVSNTINPRLKTKLSSLAPPPSVLVLDHLTPDLASAIYQLNFETK